MTPPPDRDKVPRRFRDFFKVFQYSRAAISLTWTTSRGLAIIFGLLTLLAGILPAGLAYVSKLLVDSVVTANASGLAVDRQQALVFVAVEAGLVLFLAAAQRGLSVCESLLQALLSQRVNVMILEKALTLDLAHFEDSETYDKLTQARTRASSRPLSLVQKTFGLLQNSISLLTYGGILFSFSGWAVAILVVAGLPAFLIEVFYSGKAFRLFTWQSQEMRQRAYLEILIAREDHVKEVKLYQLGQLFLDRFNAIFHKLYAEDRDLTIRRGFWGFVLSLLGTVALYGAFVWVVKTAASGGISLGDMTMYLLVFKQGQAAVTASLSGIGRMYEDNLYLSNLYEFLHQPVDIPSGTVTQGARPGDGVRFEQVSFVYPGARQKAVDAVDLHLEPGKKLALVGENGSGKTTLIKLLTRLYEPTEGRILLDGTPLPEWDIAALRDRIGVIFQDFVRYQFLVGENIGAGDVAHFEEPERWHLAARKGLAHDFISSLPEGYHTQLGKWFAKGRELSGGQWQKVALSRAFMRERADILVLDEPTSAMDPEAEARIFEHFREVTEEQMAILISHRFSTVRMADQIVVLSEGRVLEQGSHHELLERKGRYAELFHLQAKGYR
ncbi:MAG: ABC transporter ATP-binding protein [Vulcanimicrobiota bacterium]